MKKIIAALAVTLPRFVASVGATRPVQRNPVMPLEPSQLSRQP